MGQLATDRFGCSGRRVPANLFLLLGFRSLSRFSHGRVHVTGWRFFLLVFVKTAFLVLSSLRFVRGLDLLSSTPGITVVVGFPFIASPESPCASETHGLFLAVNGRTATAPSRPERGSLAHCQARILQWPTNPSILVQTCHVVEVTLFTPSRQVHTTTAKAWRSSPRT